jgi:hypothetical protein
MTEIRTERHREGNVCLVCEGTQAENFVHAGSPGSWIYASFHGVSLYAGPFCSVACCQIFLSSSRSEQYRRIFGSARLGRYMTWMARKVRRTGQHDYTVAVTTVHEPCPHTRCANRKYKDGVAYCDVSLLHTLEFTEREWTPDSQYGAAS